jgi:3',5'-cyclic AMP phosphodiesterase CpdA
MSVLLQVSDAHFGTEKPAVVEALVALASGLAPDLVVVSGDITQRARSYQFERAAAFVKRLPVPRVLTIAGNHDIPLFDLVTRFRDPYGGFRRAFGDELEPRHEAPDCLVLTVKTTRRRRHTDGEISDEQRARVSAELRRATADQVRIVITHHPLAVPRAAEVHNVAHGSEEAMRAWAEAGADVLLAGHIHLPFVIPLHETLGSLPRALWAVNAGTAVSTRTRRDAGNSVNVLRVASRASGASPSCTVEHWTFNAPKGAFLRAFELSLDLGPLSGVRAHA